MCPNGNNKTLTSALGYSYPKYHKGKHPYVDFYCFDPASGCAKRKKFMIDKNLPKREQEKRGQEIIARLTPKLLSGWNPFVDVQESRGYTKIEDIFCKYEALCCNSSRVKTNQSYRSHLKVFKECKEFLSTYPIPVVYAYQLDSAVVVSFLDYVTLDREVSPRTRNNYLGWIYSFCSFMNERKYLSENPAQGIDKIREDQKQREALTTEELKYLFSKLKDDKPHFLLACLMEYYTFFRPSELSALKIEYINIADKTVFVPGEVSKNRKNGGHWDIKF